MVLARLKPFWSIIHDDCAHYLATVDENSIDCVVTDPPYGLSFMGSDWDRAIPEKRAFQQIFRVLKPGALAFVMSSPRQDMLWRMMQMLEECGFQLRQSFISWIYKSGFPKAYDLSLGVDKKFIRKEFVAEHGRKPTREELKQLMKDKRKKIGEGKGTSLKNINLTNKREGYRPKDYYKNYDGVFDITEPYNPDAKKWDGWKSITGLKPALECILMVNKPMSESTIVDNVLRWGTGAMNVDGCRIPFKNEREMKQSSRPNSQGKGYSGGYHDFIGTNRIVHNKGRFPANLLVSDGAIDSGKISKSTGHFNKKRGDWGGEIYGKHKGFTQEDRKINDIGDQSRYFDLDAWAEHYGFLNIPKPSKREKDKGVTLPKGNPHITVKPVKLMAYLITLGCARRRVVLDPYAGTGTTMVAAKMLNRSCVGIDIDAGNCKISQERVDAVLCEMILDDYL